MSGGVEDGLAVTLSFARASGDGSNEWEPELKAVEVDRFVRILPGVRSLLDLIPDGRYAIATSGAKAYGKLRIVFTVISTLFLVILPAVSVAIGLTGEFLSSAWLPRPVGIISPKVTITADDPRLRAGKPAPDPFLLAAECLGCEASRCVVFEDSPNGIKAGVASGATVVAVCTSHSRKQIEECGAHFVVDNLEDVRCEEMKTDDGTRLMFTEEH